MAIEIRTIEPEEHRTFVASLALPFLEPVTDDLVEAEELIHETDRCWAAFDGDRMVGNAAALTRNVTVPGGTGALCPVVGMAGVTSVGVHPTHRRRGILRRLMAAVVDQAMERGEPLAGLGASEGGIYGRFGFGVASHDATVSLDPRAVRLAPTPAPVDLALMDGDEAGKVLPELFERLRRARPGQVDRRPGEWAARSRDLRAPGEAPAMWAVGHDGYVCYRVAKRESRVFHRGTLEVHDLLGATAEVEAGLWAYLAGIDLVDEIRAGCRPVDDPARWRLSDPRAWHVVDVLDSLWLKVLDVPAALSARRYPAEGTLVLDVVARAGADPDPAVGRWCLQAGPEGAEAHPARPADTTDLRLGPDDLGALYLGGVAASTLAAAGRATEERAGALALADRLLASPVAPLNSTGF